MNEYSKFISQIPDLTPVIAWLENGCAPREAALELRIYQEKIKELQRKLLNDDE